MDLLFGKGNRKPILVGIDIAIFLLIDAVYYGISKLLGYGIGGNEDAFLRNSVILLCCILAMRTIAKLYRSIWRYTSTFNYFRIILTDACGCILAVILIHLFSVCSGFWHIVTVTALTALATLSSRLCYRLLYKRKNGVKTDRPRRKTAIAGAGQLGAFLAHDLQNNPNSMYQPMFFIDCDKNKIGNFIAGLPVYDEEKIEFWIEKMGITEVIIAITKANSEQVSRLYHYYNGLGCKVKIYDSLVSENEKENAEQKRTIREFEIEDLLFREPLNINNQMALNFYEGKTVLVTGGGGSIGSELCRQVVKCKPKKLVIVDIYENNAYDIQQELLRNYGDKIDFVVEIGSVRDLKRMECIFQRYQPQVVFHAAAHKHVPLMEHSAGEAIKNNVIGTYNIANLAEKYEVEKFILISTDKAVNPTNIMGASKRMCEMLIQCRTDSKTNFAAVRFGNVLGSNGSVIPLFKKQIAAGGPVTITDKRITRYFMTIPEASQLVIQAGAMAKKGELFVLDMGKPVKIYNLAVNMIRLSGLVPNVDIEIKEIGLRPGEKLYEELLMKTEVLDKTENDMIFIEKDACLTREEVERRLNILRKALEDTEKTGSAAVKEAFKDVVPTYQEMPEI